MKSTPAQVTVNLADFLDVFFGVVDLKAAEAETQFFNFDQAILCRETSFWLEIAAKPFSYD